MICGRGRDIRTQIPPICEQFPRTKKFLNGENNPHAKFQPSNISDTIVRAFKSSLWDTLYKFKALNCPKIGITKVKRPAEI